MRLYELLAGLSLALVSQTSSRSESGLGFGEVGLAVCVISGVASGLSKNLLKIRGENQKLAASLLLYAFFPLLPTTLLNAAAGVEGVSVRDWVAYVLSFLFIASLARERIRLDIVVKAFLLCLLPLLLYQYAVSGFSGGEAGRFAGGAHNPNQLALYVACANLLIAVSDFSRLVKITASVLFLIFGIFSLSDAYMVGLAGTLIAYIAIVLVPRRRFFPWGIFILLVLCVGLVFFSSAFLELTSEKWNTADEGGVRLDLYANGISAWLNSLYSFVLGNGAGSFSGLLRPFQGAEAHNTPIDVLAMGGVLGIFVFYGFPVRALFGAYKMGFKLPFSLLLGLLVFTFFHFVARQPIFWFTILVVIDSMEKREKVD